MANLGNVYIFNLYSASVTSININGQNSSGTIGAPAKTTTPPYAPPQLMVPRSQYPPNTLDSGAFCFGDNTVSINYGGEQWSGTITVPRPPNPPQAADLWLYLAFEQMFLFNSLDGSIIQQPGGGMLKAQTKGGGGGSDSAPLKRQGGGVSAKATAKASGGGKGGASKGGASKGGASKGGASKGGASKGGAKKSAKKS